jgi:hypothetical protein
MISVILHKQNTGHTSSNIYINLTNKVLFSTKGSSLDSKYHEIICFTSKEKFHDSQGRITENSFAHSTLYVFHFE